MKKKIVFFTGAGVSKESGIDTFRDSGGLWENFRIEDVATSEAWKNNTKVCIDFYNQRRKDLEDKSPNKAHELIVKLEEHYDVIVVTQNVDNLHEKAGSKNIYHLHGELTKVRSEKTPSLLTEIGYAPIKYGDLASDDEQLRPHIVLFGEDVPMLQTVVPICNEADIFVVVGSSLNVYPAASLIDYTKEDAKIYNINPEKVDSFFDGNIENIQEVATKGMEILWDKLVK